MPKFDVEGARKAGYSDDEILQHLTTTRKFDVDGAVKAGYSKQDIITHLATTPAPAAAGQGGKSWLDSAGDFVKGFWSQTNPVTIVSGAADLAKSAVTHPIDTAGGILKAQDAVRLKAEEAFKTGNYAEGVRHTLGYLLPLVGPQIDAMGDKAQEGRVAEAMGEAAGFGVVNTLPAHLPGSVTARIKPRLNAAKEAAVSFADRRGIPVPMSTRTGGKLAHGLENLLENDLGASRYAADARDATTTGLRRVGSELADETHPGPATEITAGADVQNAIQQSLKRRQDVLARGVHPQVITEEQAGANVASHMQREIRNYHQQANASYKEVWKAEQDPHNVENVVTDMKDGKPVVTEMPLPIDMEPLQKALKPLAERYEYTMTSTDQRASQGLKALRNIIDGPRYKPASAAELDLGMLKEASRAEMPELRDISQGLAAAAVKGLQDTIDAKIAGAYVPGAAAGTSPALAALRKGRELTAKKHDTADFLKSISGGKSVENIEPVQVFKGLTWQGDSGIQRLRELAQRAPERLPEIGRAFIDSGGSWEKLGPETKRLLFKDPALIQSLDEHFAWAGRVNSLTSAKEPVKVFRMLTQDGDASVEILREVRKKAPQEVPKIGRAYLEGLLETATSSGDFEKVQSVLNSWNALGPETKRLLFKSPNQVQDIGNFFRLAKDTFRPQNPSGTAYATLIGSHVATLAGGAGMLVFGLPGPKAMGSFEAARIIGNAALARLMFNPKAARALVTGLKVPVKSPAAAAAAANILRLAGEDAKPVEQSGR